MNTTTYASLGLILLLCVSCQRTGDSDSKRPDDQALETRVVLTEALRIGDESTGDTTLFGNIGSLAVDSRGQIYVSDDGWIGIRVYTADGAFEHKVGREGGGPGEFSGDPEIHIGSEDTLYAWDWQEERISIFSPYDHEFVTSFVVDEPEDDRNSSPYGIEGVSSQGFLIHYGTVFWAGDPEAGTERYEAVRLVSWDGAIGETVARLPVAEAEHIVITTANSTSVRMVPFVPQSHFVYSPGQALYYGLGDAINLVGAMPGAEHRQVASVTFDPVPISFAERDSIVSNASSRWRAGLSEKLPETKPAFNDLLADDKGRLWLKLSREAGALQNTWWVVDASSGELTAEIQLPRSVELYAIRHNRAFGAMNDEDTGAPFVVVWNLDE